MNPDDTIPAEPGLLRAPRGGQGGRRGFVKDAAYAPQQERLTVTARRAKAAELYLKGKPMRVIASEVGVSLKTIHRDITACEEEWLERQAVATNRRKATQLAKLDLLEQELWELYSRSLTVDERKVARTELAIIPEKDVPVRNEDVIKAVSQTLTEKRIGDTAVLAKILDVIQERNKILGLYAPTEFKGTFSWATFLQSDTVTESNREMDDYLARRASRLLDERRDLRDGILPGVIDVTPLNGNGHANGNGAGNGHGDEED